MSPPPANRSQPARAPPAPTETTQQGRAAQKISAANPALAQGLSELRQGLRFIFHRTGLTSPGRWRPDNRPPGPAGFCQAGRLWLPCVQPHGPGIGVIFGSLHRVDGVAGGAARGYQLLAGMRRWRGVGGGGVAAAAGDEREREPTSRMARTSLWDFISYSSV